MIELSNIKSGVVDHCGYKPSIKRGRDTPAHRSARGSQHSRMHRPTVLLVRHYIGELHMRQRSKRTARGLGQVMAPSFCRLPVCCCDNLQRGALFDCLAIFGSGELHLQLAPQAVMGGPNLDAPAPRHISSPSATIPRFSRSMKTP